MKEDKIIVEVDPDTGLIKTTTPKISAANHSNAAQFLDFMNRLCGGETTATPRSKTGHTHAHGKEHSHEGH